MIAAVRTASDVLWYAYGEKDNSPPAQRRIETMWEKQGVLLTGATGLLGRYLLRDLLVKGCPTTVLVRDSKQGRAADRIAELVAFWNEYLHRKLPTPVVLAGELGPDDLGLTAADRR
jgi:hypothetical protein